MDIAAILANRPDQITADDGVTVNIHWDTTWYRPDTRDAHASHVEHGTCLRLDDDLLGDPASLVEIPDVGKHWPYTWEYGERLPTVINGVDPDELGEAIRLLLLSARAQGAFRRLRKLRMDHSRKLLQEAAALCAERHPDHFGRRAHLNHLIEVALGDGLLSPATIAEASGEPLSLIEATPSDPRSVPYYLDTAGFARLLAVGESTMRVYKSRGYLPTPDIELGGASGWELATAIHYARHRPGQGRRVTSPRVA